MIYAFHTTPMTRRTPGKGGLPHVRAPPANASSLPSSLLAPSLFDRVMQALRRRCHVRRNEEQIIMTSKPSVEVEKSVQFVDG